jgi:hypothetical protein
LFEPEELRDNVAYRSIVEEGEARETRTQAPPSRPRDACSLREQGNAAKKTFNQTGNPIQGRELGVRINVPIFNAVNDLFLFLPTDSGARE